MSDEAARLLAEIHAARALARALARAATPATRPGVAALWAHATRDPGGPVDLATVRAIRADPGTARRYRALLASQAMAHAPFAVAASDGPVASRRIGAFTLEILAATEDAPPLLILRGSEARSPRLIEVILGDETLRVALPPPIEGAILLALDPAVPEAVRLGAMLRDPACAAFLL
ncbi:hypothetical protein ASF22_09470 [Methylobacterium sp. Leaf87]|jgi:hypothetical protein|uniref:hypothetical protein n=1 Tax=Methylobacterium sp. Leaf87 TaxID=1736243 RepID=UPI0006F844CF|nr:hypothetical protein [Methylobacterium sp. Leaf87]KQO56750.1 hypothetical protein ASF22_09470 [Methylobacterium sp. Leaf87]USU31174.1 hypothetical protein NG677_17760 [Methylobacterium sp. OTU13CASTA1]